MPRQVLRRTPVDPSTPVTGAPQQQHQHEPHQRQPPPVRNPAAGAPVFETPPGFQFPPDAVHPRRGVETLVGALPAWQLPTPPPQRQQARPNALAAALAAAGAAGEAAAGRGRQGSHTSELEETTEGDENNFDDRDAEFNGVIDEDEEDVDEGDEEEEEEVEEEEEDEDEDEEMHDRGQSLIFNCSKYTARLNALQIDRHPRLPRNSARYHRWHHGPSQHINPAAALQHYEPHLQSNSGNPTDLSLTH